MQKKPIVLGIDIGGTNTVFGFISKEGKIINKKTIPTLASGGAKDFFYPEPRHYAQKRSAGGQGSAHSSPASEQQAVQKNTFSNFRRS